MDNTPPSKRMWRSLIRVVEIHGQNLKVVIPAWNASETIMVSCGTEIANKLKPGDRCFADVNIGAENAHELRFDKFEIDGVIYV
jgi:hypothetical protein